MKINQAELMAEVKRALAEDIGRGDVSTSLLSEDTIAAAEIISREPMLVCGIPWVDAVFTSINSTINLQWLVKEGEWRDSAALLCKIQGKAADILTAERSALNFLQTLSATATKTYRYVQCLSGTKTKLLDTRKTIPGLRLAQKYAVTCGGGVNHRMGLYDAFLIKENHIKACGSISNAVQVAKAKCPHLFVEVEVETLDELTEALQAKPDRILLDNFNLEKLRKAVALNQLHQCQLEASGGVNLDTIRAIAETGVDYISVGEITKSITAIDLSLLVRKIL